ncbi:MAG TPA: HD domain-containing phosphohydrolase [Nitriliruptorales bacterium]
MAATVADLRRSELLDTLPEDALVALSARARRRTWAAGEPIFDRGAVGSSLHIVLSGAVEIRPTVDDDTRLAYLEAGENFGELAVFDPAPRSAAAVADQETVTLEVDRADLEEVLLDRPTAAMRIMGSMARSLTENKEEVTYINKHLDQLVKERTSEVRETQLEVIRRLGFAAEYRDEDTGAHIYRMSNYAAELSKRVGFTDDRAEVLMNAAPMHDVGKIGVPDRILLKPAKLDADEWEIMQAHTIMGANMLAGSRSSTIRLAGRIALTHHEKWDGSGYPHGLAGEDILIEARICCVADVFDALTSVRPYKQAWTFDAALEEIESQSGKGFDPVLVTEFTSMQDQLQEIHDRAQQIGEVSREVLTAVDEYRAEVGEIA